MSWLSSVTAGFGPAAQPPLHEAVICVHDGRVAISGSDGQIRRGGAHGVYIGDRRLLNLMELRIDGLEAAPIARRQVGADAAWFAGALWRDQRDPDPALVVRRERRVAGGVRDTVVITNYGRADVAVSVELELGADGADIFAVKAGQPGTKLAPAPVGELSGVAWTLTDRPETLRVEAEPPPSTLIGGRLEWSVGLAAGETWQAVLTVHAAARPGEVAGPSGPAPWSRPVVTCADERLALLVERGVADLEALLLADPEHPGDVFAAAGAPWFMTLFGRDSLWAARMALPLGTKLAAGTLRALARRQGERYDRVTEEAPGKILHELRRADPAARGELPPQYYGSVDATALFVTLVVDAWRWGLATEVAEELLPHVERALTWLKAQAADDPAGFLRYSRGGTGLTNQGWKDSDDGVQFADGQLAAAPLALCEVQGYAYRAAATAADLLEAFGRPGAASWRAWAADLRARFVPAFWVDTPDGGYPAVALDGAGTRVDSLTSNAGHLLTTGILDPPQQASVAAALVRPELDSGWGLRTLSSASPAFNPLSYHGGSVWAHDTAIAVHGLAAIGAGTAAGSLLRGLLAAAPWFDYRLPELHGGLTRRPGQAPLAYPAACRPQAWAAAAAVLLVEALLGLQPDVPAGRVVVAPLRPFPFRFLRVTGLTIAGHPFDVAVDGDGIADVLDVAPGLTVEVTA